MGGQRNRDQAAPALLDPARGLWLILPPPLIAGVHFTVCYIATSVFCLRAPAGDLSGMRLALGGLTLLALAAIALCALAAWRRWRRARPAADQTGPAARVAFLSRVVFYLAALSWVGVVFIASPLLFVGTCR